MRSNIGGEGRKQILGILGEVGDVLRHGVPELSLVHDKQRNYQKTNKNDKEELKWK